MLSYCLATPHEDVQTQPVITIRSVSICISMFTCLLVLLTARECKLQLVSSCWRRVMRTRYSAARRDRGGHRPTLATTSPGICQISKLRFGTGKRARCRSLRTVASVCMTRCRGRPRDLVTAMVIRFLGNLFCPNVNICCDLVCFFFRGKTQLIWTFCRFFISKRDPSCE